MNTDQALVFIDKKNIPNGSLTFATRAFYVNCGKGCAIPALEKREGDHKSPWGRYQFKQVFYRADRIEKPHTILPVTEITPDMGWCDDPEHPDYNRLIRKPFIASHEDMHRDDSLYDLVVEISHNDNPPIPYLGCAVFLHLIWPEKSGTAGCLAFDHENLRFLLDNITKDTVLDIRFKP